MPIPEDKVTYSYAQQSYYIQFQGKTIGPLNASEAEVHSTLKWLQDHSPQPESENLLPTD